MKDIQANESRTDSAPVSDVAQRKTPYTTPVLQVYGSISDLTMSGSGTGADGGLIVGMQMVSDRTTKENIVRIGTHPLGIGLYLFDYKPEYRDANGHGRQFGVMADEVEGVLPAAVLEHADGYKMVDYGLLAQASRAIH